MRYGGCLFRPAASQVGLSTDNSWVQQTYREQEDGEKKRAYGRIQRIFRHTLCTEQKNISVVFVEVLWMEEKERNPGSLLPTAEPSRGWDNVIALDACDAVNLVLWPSSDKLGFYDVIHKD